MSAGSGDVPNVSNGPMGLPNVPDGNGMSPDEMGEAVGTSQMC